MSAIYTGPQCPHCTAPLDLAAVHTGLTACPSCTRAFEATPFQAIDRKHDTVQVVTETPDGVAAACANHARNASVTSCQRCGLFICALCDINTGDGSYCPSCFDRIRNDGSLQARYRDYATMSVSGAVVGLLCTFIPIGPFVVYWAFRGIQQRRREGQGMAGPVIAMIFGILETLVFFGTIILMIIGAAAGAKS